MIKLIKVDFEPIIILCFFLNGWKKKIPTSGKNIVKNIISFKSVHGFRHFTTNNRRHHSKTTFLDWWYSHSTVDWNRFLLYQQDGSPSHILQEFLNKWFSCLFYGLIVLCRSLIWLLLGEIHYQVYVSLLPPPPPIFLSWEIKFTPKLLWIDAWCIWGNIVYSQDVCRIHVG